MNPGDRPRRGIAKALAVLSTAGVVAGLSVLADTDPAAAGELERFASCEAIAEWGAVDRPTEESFAVPDAVAADEATASGAGGGDDAAPRDAADGGTTGGDLGAAEPALPPGASAPSTLATSGEATSRSTETAADPDAQGGDELAATGEEVQDGTNVIVEGVDELDVIDLLDQEHALVSAAARLSIIDLVDDEVVANLPIPHQSQITYDRGNDLAWVVGPDDAKGRLTVTRVEVTTTSLTEGDAWSTDGWLVDARRIGDRLYLVASDGYDGVDPAAIPFADGPVACDQVLHPVGQSDPSATLLVELPATGPLQPVHATEVVGSGSSIHVTTEAAYLATPLYGGTTQTSFHRFDLATLAHTGSGRVDGYLLDEFAMSDHDGFLRVAVTLDGGMRGVAVDAMPTDLAVDIAPTTTPGRGGEPLNEIVVLDTQGDLDVVGRTARFGHPGETLHGIRFVGTTAYAVTFLQTDPFFVVDLQDPTAPRIAGEVQLPGFSSYLHPVGDGLVAGFGPDGDGKIGVKLFDVADPARPAVVDQLALGDESPVAWDHHAFVDLGAGRFAVPGTTYREVRPADCTPERQRQRAADEQRINDETDELYRQVGLDGNDEARLRQLELERQAIFEEGCLYPTARPESSVLVVDTSGGSLQLVQRLGSVPSAHPAERVVATDDGWALLGGNRWVVLDGDGDQVADLELGPEQPVSPVDDLGGRPMPIEG